MLVKDQSPAMNCDIFFSGHSLDFWTTRNEVI